MNPVVTLELIAGVSFVFAILAMLITSVNSAEGVTNEDIYPINSEPYGLSYGEWSAKWWQWVMSIPPKDNPGVDETGEKCNIGQNDTNVWFLAGTGGGKVSRICTVPAGMAILFPIINVECDYVSDKSMKSELDLRQCAKSDQDKATNLKVSIDGFNVPDLKNYRVQSPLFNFTLPKDNVAGYPEGVTQAISDGYWIVLKPLPPGKHEIQFSGSIADFTATGPLNFVSDASYEINVLE